MRLFDRALTAPRKLCSLLWLAVRFFFSRTIIKIPFHAKQDLSSTCLSEKDGLDLIAKLIENLYFTRAVFNG